MADRRLHVVGVPVGWDVDAEVVRGLGLAKAGNVVVLAFDREQGDIADRRRIDAYAAMRHLALGQGVADEHGIDGLQVEFRRQVHHRQIFVVEIAVLLGIVAIMLHQMHEEVLVGDDVAVEVHAHEARKLQEAGIDLAAEARHRPRRAHDDVVAEPVDALFLPPEG